MANCILLVVKPTFAFSIQGQIAHAELACTSGFWFFSSDHSSRTPSSLSITLKQTMKRFENNDEYGTKYHLPIGFVDLKYNVNNFNTRLCAFKMSFKLLSTYVMLSGSSAHCPTALVTLTSSG